MQERKTPIKRIPSLGFKEGRHPLAYSIPSLIIQLNPILSRTLFSDSNDLTRDVNRKPEIRFSVLKPKAGSISLATAFQIYFLSFGPSINDVTHFGPNFLPPPRHTA